MTTIAIPSWFGVDGFSLRMSTVQRTNMSPFGGSEQVIDLLNDRWHASLSIPPRIFSEAAGAEAFVASLRGSTNTINLYHFARPQPRGTMRGAPLTNGAFAGADSMIIGTPAGNTLLAGDMISFDGLLVMVRDDCVANGSGAMTVNFVNKLRRTVAAGLPVVWDKPTAPFRCVSTPSVQYVPGYAEGVSLDFVEAVP